MSQEQVYGIDQGDVLEVLRTYPDNYFHGLLCDPPYGLNFMGKKWDYSVPKKEVWAECLRVLRPGAALMAFGGSRTFHRLAVEIEDAGFELRDTLMWVYGSGFPKSLDVSKAIDGAASAVREVVGTKLGRPGMSKDGSNQRSGFDSAFGGEASGVMSTDITAPATDLARDWAGHGTALKPAHEPIILARKPMDGTAAQNVARWGVGALAIDASRIEATDKKPAPVGQYSRPSVGTTAHSGIRDSSADHLGRWPANVILDSEAGAILDEQTGIQRARGNKTRFFYCAKASRKEREKGCEHLPLKSGGECTDREDDSAGATNPRSGACGVGGARNHHPTVKPIDLIRYLARLIMPPTPGATLLIPFSGSGSEITGSLLAGWSTVVGIEREADYIQIAHARIPAHVKGVQAA